MKTSRAELKAIVKECLMEILQEGLGNAGSFTSQVVPAMSQSKHVFSEKSRIQKTESSTRSPAPALREAVRREAGGNRVMESILADTAASTLPKMLQNEGRKQPVPTGTVEQIVAAVNPEELFGSDVASKWADLAFMDSVKK
jgi:hypothetical protein